MGEHALAFAALARSEALLRSTLRATSEGIVVHASTGEIVDCNPAAERILGLSREQMTGRTSMDPRWRAEHEDGSPFPGETHPGMVTLATGHSVRDVIMVVRKPDGERTRIKINSEPIGEAGERPSAVVATFVDVTRYHENEQHLREALARVEDLYQKAPCGYHSLAPDGTYLEINDTELAWLGATRGEVVGQLRPSDFMTEQGRAVFAKRFATLRQGVAALEEVELVSRTGERRWVSVTATMVMDDAGRFVRSRAVMYDITELARARAELLDHLREREAMLDNDLVPIVVLGERRILWANAAMSSLFGYAHSEMLGRSTRMFYADDATFEAEGRDFAAQLARDGSARNHVQLLHRNGSVREVDVFGTRLRGGAETLCFLIDQTPQRDAEQRLQAMLRMEAVQRLAGGVAHELNNQLQVIGGSASLLLAEPVSEEATRTLHAMENAVDRSAALIRQLLTYAGRQVVVPRHMRLDDAVSAVLEPIRAALPAGIRLDWLPAAGDAEVFVDASLLAAAISALLLNAREAVHGRGTITLGTGRLDLRADRPADAPEDRSGVFAFVAITDDGAGMSESVRSHAFEPFFTTREFGHGAGLGLASAMGFAAQAGGWIGLKSAPGRGTTATIYLPLA